MVKQLLLLLVTICICCGRSAQAQSDTAFWFAVPEISQSLPGGSNDRPIYLNIAAGGNAATVTITQPAGAGPGYMPPQVITVPANGIRSVDLTTWIDSLECKPANTVLNYGLRITATAPVTIYHEVGSVLAPEFFVLKGRNALGTRFYIPGQNLIENAGWFNPPAKNAFDIVATEDHTTVTITPSRNIIGHAAGIPFTITLNRGQTYSATAAGFLPADHLVGSLVEADKPVAVTVKDDELWSSTVWTGSCQDADGDQIVPVQVAGREYIAIKGLLNGPGSGLGDQLFITATQNGTTILQNGTPVPGITLNAGETHRLPVSVGGAASTYIQTSAPAYVWHMSGNGCEVGSTVLPSLKCTGSPEVIFARSTNEPLYINLLVPAGGQGDFLVNGAAGIVTAAGFTAVPGTGGSWLAAQVPLSATSYPQGSAIRVSNTSRLFHLGVLNGQSVATGMRFGYFSNYGGNRARIVNGNLNLCAGDTIRLSADSVDAVSRVWTGPGGFSSTDWRPVIPAAGAVNSGVYILTVNADCGVTVDSVRVQVTDPVADLGPDTSLCSADTPFVLRGPQGTGYTYLWSTGATGDQLQVSRSGNYNLKVELGGCIAYDTVSVTVRPSPQVYLGPDTSLCSADTPFVLHGPQGPGYTYLWSTGATDNQLRVSRSGDYHLEVRRDNCSAYDTVSVEVLPVPEVNLGPDTSLCSADTPFVLHAPRSSGYTYLWSTGATGDQLQVSRSGNYSLKVELGGCIAYDTVSVTVRPSPQVYLGPDTSLCSVDTPFVLHGPQGSGYTYLWSTGATDDQLRVSRSGDYHLEVRRDNCSAYDTVSVTVLPVPEVDLGPDTSLCSADTPFVLRGPQGSGYTYLWSTGATGDQLQVSQSGNYSLKVELGGCIAYDTVSVTVRPSPQVYLGPDTSLCSADTPFVLHGPQGPGYTYLWSTGVTDDQLRVSRSGDYHLEVRRDNCSAYDTVSVMVLPAPEVDLGPDTSLCSADTPFVLRGPQGPGYTYLWSTGATDDYLRVSRSGDYRLEVRLGSCTADDTVSVTVRPSPQVYLGPDTSLCSVDTPFVLHGPQGPGYTYLWSTGATDDQLAVSRSGDYHLEVRRDNCSAYDTVSVTVLPVPEVDLGPDTSLCSADTPFVLYAPQRPGYTYLWSTGATDDYLRVSRSGDYRLEVRLGSCMVDDTVSVTVLPSPQVYLGPDTSLCSTDLPLVLHAAPQPAGSTYLWSTGASGTQTAVTADGRYWLEVTADKCRDSDTIQVTVTLPPLVDAGNDTVICTQYPLQIGTTVPGAAYLWNTGSTDPYLDVAATGEYILSVYLGGCLVRDTVHIMAMPPPDVRLGGDRYLCPQEEIMLDAAREDAAAYQWNTGAATPAISVTAPGRYSVTVTSVYACTGSDSIYVTLQPFPAVSLGGDTSLCEGNVLELVPRQEHVASLSWSDGSTADMLQVRQSGLYTVTGVNSCGSSSDTMDIRFLFCGIWVPDAFTPNGDGINDLFRVLGSISRLQQFEFSIFNRWGECVFTTAYPSSGWDGRHKGADAPIGTYAYMLRYTLDGTTYFDKGDLHLIR